VDPTAIENLYPGSRVLPRQRVGYIAISRSSLHLPPRSGKIHNRGTESLLLPGQLNYVDTLRLLLKPYLSEGYPDESLAASLMDTSVRTLARRLSEFGVSYQKVIDDLRFTEAKTLLQTTDASITDVASAVGFDDVAHFSRMFHRICGLSPREFRKIRMQE
jgi:AraC-like DNA-binding protein